MWFHVYSTTCLIVAHVTSLTALMSHCAVRPSGNVGRCHCSSLLEVRCENLVSVPRVDVAMATSMWTSGVTYRGLYLNRQHITSLPRAAFSSLPVNRIVLNFNNIGDNIDPDTFLDIDDLHVRHTRHSLQGEQLTPFSTELLRRLQSHSENEKNVTSRPGLKQTYKKLYKRYFESSASAVEQTLTELYMGACQITSLHVSLFRKLVNLRRLHLWANQIETIPVRMFRHNSKLTELSLWGNRIDELDANLFEGLRSLRHLDLDRNRLTSMSAGAISRLISLTKLSLNGNRIHALSYDMFPEVNSLRSVSLDSNGLAFVYGNTLRSLVRLSSLSLRRNAVHILPDEMFSGLVNLAELRLDFNRIEHVWSQTFHGLRSLVRLWMRSNKLSHVPDGAFRESSKLKHVHLADNRLTSLGPCALSDQSLQTLSLESNPMRCNCKLAWVNRMLRRGAVVSGMCQYPIDHNLFTRDSPVSIHTAAASYDVTCNQSASAAAIGLTANHECCSSAASKCRHLR